MTDSIATQSGPIIATAGKYYRNARYIMTLLILGFAVFFAYDGWKRYPEINQKIDKVDQELQVLTNKTTKTPEDEAQLKKLYDEQKELGSKHSDTDIMIQKVLACTLPVLGLGYAAFFIGRSRGQFKLENGILSAPGHPNVPVAGIEAIDNKMWDKKGIADLKYSGGVVRLDDFIYEQKPIDQIYEIIAKQHGVWKEPVKKESAPAAAE